MKFRKSEIPALDFIIDRILKNDFPLYAHELKSSGLITVEDEKEIETEFENLLSIINFYEYGNVTDARNEDHGASIEKNGNTAKFKKDGSFKKLYKSLKKKNNELKSKSSLKIKNLRLQNENFEYLKLLRKNGVTDYGEIKNSQEELNSKIDEIIESLRKQDIGQEILFNELQDLKELYPKLNKKNWGQILKGKLLDLGIAQVINEEIASNIFKELTNQYLRLK